LLQSFSCREPDPPSPEKALVDQTRVVSQLSPRKTFECEIEDLLLAKKVTRFSSELGSDGPDRTDGARAELHIGGMLHPHGEHRCFLNGLAGGKKAVVGQQNSVLTPDSFRNDAPLVVADRQPRPFGQ